MTEQILEVEGIQKYYDSHLIINCLSLALSRREIVCLLGPSGCGKTTLFRIIAGLSKADAGKVRLSPQLKVGYVFQEPRFLPWKRVEENLSFVQRNFLNELEAAKTRQSLLKDSGLEHFRDNYPDQLSGGMKQRLELIRALAIRPDFMLLDEPFKSVDPLLKIKLRKMLLEYQERYGTSLLLITHDPEEAVLLADRIYLLADKPATVIEEIKIGRGQSERTIRQDDIFSYMQMIVKILLCEK